MAEPLSPAEHAALIKHIGVYGNKQSTINALEISSNSFDKYLGNSLFRWKRKDKQILLSIINPVDPSGLRVPLDEKIKREIDGRLFGCEAVNKTLKSIHASISSGDLLTPREADRFISVAKLRTKKLLVEKLSEDQTAESATLATCLGNDQLRIWLPCIELVPCATLSCLASQTNNALPIQVNWQSANGSELAELLDKAVDDLPEVIITGVSAFALNEGRKYNGAATLANYSLYFPIHSIEQRCYSPKAEDLTAMDRIVFVPGGCTHHRARMLSRLLGRKLPELATDNVNFLENRFEIRPCDIIVAYAPIGERLQREKGLLSLEDSSHSIFLACFVHKDFMKRNPAAIQSFDRLFRMVYKSYVKSPERAMDRLLSLPSFIAAYHRSSGYGKCATKKAK